MKDKFEREITYIRLSVTDLCNLRCIYCMPENGVIKRRHEDIMRIEEIEEIVRAASSLGIKKVRVTGGEPLVRRGITEICRRVSSVHGIEEVCLTTNGLLLPQFADELYAVGVRRINISLDSLDSDTYRVITRGGDLKSALRGIDAARKAGFAAIKINVVLMDGINDGELRSLADLSRIAGTHVRFIERMPIGRGVETIKTSADAGEGCPSIRRIHSPRSELEAVGSVDPELESISSVKSELEPIGFVDPELEPISSFNSELEVIGSVEPELEPISSVKSELEPLHSFNSELESISSFKSELEPIGFDGVAQLYTLPNAGGSGTVGFISPVSQHFCASCNRIRVTSDGKLKPCLHSAEEINLRGLHGKALMDAISAAIWEKPRGHLLDSATGSLTARNMNEIGG